MVATAHATGRSGLSAARIKDFKALARRVDREEGAAIRARGRAVFRRHGMIRALVTTLKARRLARGLSLSDMAEKTGIAKPNLSRLENSERAAPTLDTLQRYAQALGMVVRVELVGKN
jgi:DNA-binding Xre family transcriptional regulator